MIYLIAIIGFILDIIFIVHDNKYHDGVSCGLKLLTSLAFIVLSIYTYLRSGNKLGIFIVLALIFNGTGDLILIFRNVWPKYHDIYYLFGTLSFLIGHVILFVYLIKINANVLLLSLIVSIILYLILYSIINKNLVVPKKLKPLGLTYMYFVLFLFIYSLIIYIKVPNQNNLMFLIGYLLFAISDYILIIHKFGKKQIEILQPIYRLLYFTSQILLALSLIFI